MAARKSAEDRRIDLLEAAGRVIRRAGFAHLTLREVAAEVGVAHSLVRHYFGTRDELLAAAFDHAAEEDQPLLTPPPGDAAGHLERLVHRTEPMDRDHYLMWIDAWSEAPRSPQLRATLRRWEDDCQRSLAALLDEGMAAGAYAIDDTMTAATRINASIDGLAIQHFASDRLTRAEMQEQIRIALEAHLGLPSGALAEATAQLSAGA
jgi:AcrR family transcriptional regulator